MTVGKENIASTGAVTLEGALNQLPQFVPENTAFSNRLGATGQATLNLRGLGSQRNLVLPNGRRLQPASSTQVVDINTIPAILVQGTEIISGGASAAYGSDAISGVVNFKVRDLQGVELKAQNTITSRGDARVRQFRKVIDEPAQLALGVGKRQRLNEPLKQELSTQPKRLFELHARPDNNIHDAELTARGSYPIALIARNGAPTNKFECVRHAARGAARLFHVACGLRFGEARAIDALDHRVARLPILELFDPDDVSTKITAGLAMPREIAPTRA